MKKIFFLIAIAAIALSCQKKNVGYLLTNDAVFKPDSMVVRQVLDPVLDAQRIAGQFPWVSIQIQGVDGTFPIRYQIANVTTTNGGDVNVFKQQCKLRGDGAFEIPLNTTIPKGRYVVDITISNEGYSRLKKNAFKVIVQ